MLGRAETLPETCHDSEQPYRRSLFVVLATDFAIGGSGGLVAPQAAQAVSRVFLVPPGADYKFRRSLSALAHGLERCVLLPFLAGRGGQRVSRLQSDSRNFP